MADIENLNEMNENFDTIKTLLNSIRAQGILNTSDVDKLLSGINSKLEKINTEEDIDLIKVFLTELKQNLDERHGVLISKFGAIESLFSNLLKNSNEQPKSAEIKELFDIVATNLSVFSREVVAQKESLTEISLRLDAIRSDDSQKKDIIKNIALLRPDLERLNNGFDTIVLSLNDNFKTLAKTISAMDKTEHLDKFADSLSGIEMSSNALMSVIELLNKKTDSVGEAIKDLVTKSDIEQTGKNIDELKLLHRGLSNTVSEINDHYGKIDVLADKIDASVSIIAGLKAGLEDSQEQNSKNIIENIDKLEVQLKEIKDNKGFEDFKTSLTSVLKDITENTSVLGNNIEIASGNVNSIIESLKALDTKANYEKVVALLNDKEISLKASIETNIDKFSSLSEANLNKIINNISLNADSLNTRINQTQVEISAICEGSFGSVFENIAELKKLISQIDENGVSANNAMFSNISDRLNLFEMSLKESLETQESATAVASAKLCEQIDNIKNLSNIFDYKMDSSVVEISNMTRMFDTLKASVDNVLALNFVETVKDLRADVYASKQEINASLENTSSDLSENLTKDLYGKYELLISKLDSIDDDFKKTQSLSLTYIKEITEKISESIVDILSYVSEAREFPTDEIDKKLINITDTLKEVNLNYVESVRDVVDVIRVQVENNLNELGVTSAEYWNKVQGSIEANTEYLKNDIKNSYEKLLEVKQDFEDLRGAFNLNTINDSDKFEKLFTKADSINSDFDLKLAGLRNTLLDKITDYKKEFTCESADKINEIRFNIENLNNKHSQEIADALDKFKIEIENISTENVSARNLAVDALLGDLSDLKALIKTSFTESATSRSAALDELFVNLTELKALINEVSGLNSVSRESALKSLSESINGVNSQIEKAFSNNDISRESALKSLSESINGVNSQIEKAFSNNDISRESALKSLSESINGVNSQIEKAFSDNSVSRESALKSLSESINGVNSQIEKAFSDNSVSRESALKSLSESINGVNSQIEKAFSDNSVSRESALKSLSESINGVNSQIEKAFLDNNTAREGNFKFLMNKFEEVKTFIQSVSSQVSTSDNDNRNVISDSLAEIQNLIRAVSSESSNIRKDALDKIIYNFDNVQNSLNDISYDLSEGRKTGLNSILENITDLKEQMMGYVSESADSSSYTISKLTENYENLKTIIDEYADNTLSARTKAFAQILDNFVGIKEYVKTLNEQILDNFNQKTNDVAENIEAVKSMLSNLDEEIDGDLTRQLSIIESNFESLISQISILNDKSEQTIVDKINFEYQNISERLEDSLNNKLEAYKSTIENTFDTLSQKVQSQSDYLQERVSDINTAMKTVWAEQAESNIKQIDEISSKLKEVLEENIKLTNVDYISLKNRLDDFTKELESNNEVLTQNLKAQLDDMTKYMDSILDIQVQETGAKVEGIEKTLSSLSERVMLKLEESKALSSEQLDLATHTKADVVSMSQLVSDTLDKVSDISLHLDDKTEHIINITTDASANEIKSMEASTLKILEQIQIAKQSIEVVKDFVSDTLQNKLNILSENIEKETNVVVNELVEQFDLMKKSQQDSVVQITSGIEAVIADQIYNNIEDLKSYLDIKTDSSMVSEKLDNLKIDIIATMDNLVSDMNKMLRADLFTTAIADYRVANEILVNSAADRVNEKIATFIGETSSKIVELQENANKDVENKLALFDKKFVDTVVDKFEEVKLISNKYNSVFDEIKDSIGAVISEFQGVKNEFEVQINKLIETIEKTSSVTDNELRQLNDCFENLRSQISNKSFDEAFQASINKQIASLENLINEQFTYIEDINELCGINLPDVAELNTFVKSVVVDKLDNLADKIKNNDISTNVDKSFENANNLIVSTAGNLSEQFEAQSDMMENLIQELFKDTKSEIITQFLNIFNQISFVTEQEEILDFIQDKHDDLIKVLSHMVTNSGDIAEVKESVNSVKDEINIINQKISSIISADGDVDYIYSLQDLESDIAHLRIVLKEMKDNTDNYGDDFGKLMDSTDGVYKLVESIKEELPDKKSFDNLTEDIVSISTRTNKLILASDESYKTLTDNLQDFKLVINDLDERTRNFAQESGMDKINIKLNALNSMVQNGEKTNQVFNEVFEYLAEWVDNAGNQINAISNKVESLDDIGQIKVMLQDLKAEAEDNSENVELVEALSTVFDKQAKRISTLEAKLDKIIVEATISNKNNKIDMQPMEDTLNRFLAAIGEKISSQQEKIDSLEFQMKEMVNMLDEKDTAQLTKKVGGMDRQIAKLNKSIEKIASHVVEK